ncbi:leucyl/phenylalanyl-tRNA--protein transferase [Acetobacter oeni]|uniref:Leucyl/phenylalanyl-tRNA--protein transferase n=1 Tax=Acetobacter oeni TaxID=304077 RepID=A0A511XG64_9PROT|nr:leucyl/phenylalanyl-tRNA--protein transferase [Acetobacter oeni]MBB3882153.1 leucyl/phenylalanyl-tRNA--protein transferase [Acetobacter oeni]GBR01505.1 leucyl/phenylalanyl-tRNA--protein transferase [Acetobacter oeni LMG 21952]GEN61925.1 leucyl/phenylalanyl-tRNA--protein transferase [Acetobacter oeni]
MAAEMALTPDMMLRAYSIGLFPMGDSEHPGRLDWYDPDPRGVLPLQGFHLHRRLARTVLSGVFDIRTDTVFEETMRACAAPAPGRNSTWITESIISLFCALHVAGFAHSVEAYCAGELVGGLYGVSLGGAFFGESMFSRKTDASKVALTHLVARLRLAGFCLLDTQFGTSHLASFGGIEISASEYKDILARAITVPVVWNDVTAEDIAKEIRRMRGERRAQAGS